MTVSESANQTAKRVSHRADWPLKLWLGYGSWCACLGWILSAVGQLNVIAYAAAGIVTIAITLFLLRRFRPALPRIPLRRFRKPLSFIYLVLLAGSFLGGLIYAPNNYDMLTYRLPRILNWLAVGHWNWIPGYIDRMNYSGTGWEWMAVPLVIFVRGTSLFFLINILSYLLLPGMFFSFLRNVGVSGRMAWAWMWLLPAGLNFVMQAGGGANDTLSVVYLLAALFFAYRARRNGNASDIFWSMISAALMTACKSSNLPLALPCVVALLPSLPKLKRHLPVASLVLCIAILSSLLPTLLINYKFTHDWMGSPDDIGKLKIHNPIAGILGNTLQLGVANLQPPLMPLASKWNEVSRHLLPPAIGDFLQRDFPRFSLHMNELPQEEASGLGLGLTAMALISLIATGRGMLHEGNRAAMNPRPVLIAGLLAFLAFMAMLGSEAAARIASPYYLFLIAPLLIHPINDRLARQKGWQVCAALASLVVLPGLILTPSRPLFPAVRWIAALAERHPDNQALHRAAGVYQVYSNRADNLGPLRKFIPDGEKTIGVVGTLDTSETSLWMPFGSRRVIELVRGDDPATVRSEGIHLVVLGADGLNEHGWTISDFLSRFDAKILGQEALTLKVTEGPEQWYVVSLR